MSKIEFSFILSLECVKKEIIFAHIQPWGQIHQYFTRSHEDPKSKKKDCQVKQLFGLLGSVRVKAVQRMLLKLTTGISQPILYHVRQRLLLLWMQDIKIYIVGAK